MPSACGVIWLASYPKCGNTWLRSFLMAYLDPEGHVDVNGLDASISSYRPSLDDALGIATSDLTPEETRELLPVAFRAWAMTNTHSYVKVHDAFGYSRSGDALFPPDVTLGVIHLVRDPRDVSVSLHHHRGATLDETIERLNDPREWIAKDRIEVGAQVPQYLSDWSSHTQSWLGSPLRRLTLRYEDMLVKPVECFRQVVSFCGLGTDDVRLSAAVAATSFESLKKQEAEKGFRERRVESSEPFFRQGRAGGWREVLSADQAKSIERAHGDMMRQLGYDV